ncbi:GNAT family N-acetyltransferase [Iocasia frigidifontis]|uniref:GNAT family N-acetyltransferase n=1 Tax=Iocasia fonsfrigidae TaxID=2682810 RepID=A0A8A7K8J9_9FIRM|nr:N-acetyltransferase [Iocasia fonsfrigidae]QTL97530.1 GNAT family N-acetyltransferase [Iocasia fonsfrigidae]
MENILIRLETQEDYSETENMIREAFWDVYKPGCDEHLVLHKLRQVSAFVEELDLVACDNNKIVGNIVYSKAKIMNNQNQEFTVLCMGPLGVLPSYQGRGIGSLLIKQSISKAKLLGYKAVVIFGDPNYYRRFGFENAEKYNIQTAQGENFDAFMVLELYDDSLNGIQGKFFDDPVFRIQSEELELFEKEFPYKVKHIIDTQLK